MARLRALEYEKAGSVRRSGHQAESSAPECNGALSIESDRPPTQGHRAGDAEGRARRPSSGTTALEQVATAVREHAPPDGLLHSLVGERSTREGKHAREHRAEVRHDPNDATERDNPSQSCWVNVICRERDRRQKGVSRRAGKQRCLAGRSAPIEGTAARPTSWATQRARWSAGPPFARPLRGASGPICSARIVKRSRRSRPPSPPSSLRRAAARRLGRRRTRATARFATRKSGPPRETEALTARRCATASWVYTLLVLPLGVVGNANDALFKFTIAICGCAILLAAIGLAIFALTRVGRHGRKGLLVPALVTLGADPLLIGLAAWALSRRG